MTGHGWVIGDAPGQIVCLVLMPGKALIGPKDTALSGFEVGWVLGDGL